MKILHTSDWHLGHTLYGYDRTEEQMHMLSRMVDIVSVEKPDLFLLCGDVFHTSQPSAAVSKLFSDAIVSLHQAYPEMVMVVTAGNHDSATRHEVFATPWKFINVHTIGTLAKDDPRRHIISLPGKGWVVAIPYAHERNMPEGFCQTLLDAVAELNTDNLPVIMTAHTTVKGCDFKGHDVISDYMVGGIDYVDVKDMGEGYDYLALGHIHHPQFVHTGHHNVRYSGTPIAVSFDEDYPHTASIVEINSHGETPLVKEIEVENVRPLVNLPKNGFTRWETAKQLLKEFPIDSKAYIRLNVEIDDVLPQGAVHDAETLAAGKECRFCHINTRRKIAGESSGKRFSIEEFSVKTPEEVAAAFFASMGVDAEGEMMSLFRQAADLVEEDLRK